MASSSSSSSSSAPVPRIGRTARMLAAFAPGPNSAPSPSLPLPSLARRTPRLLPVAPAPAPSPSPLSPGAKARLDTKARRTRRQVSIFALDFDAVHGFGRLGSGGVRPLPARPSLDALLWSGKIDEVEEGEVQRTGLAMDGLSTPELSSSSAESSEMESSETDEPESSHSELSESEADTGAGMGAIRLPRLLPLRTSDLHEPSSALPGVALSPFSPTSTSPSRGLPPALQLKSAPRPMRLRLHTPAAARASVMASTSSSGAPTLPPLSMSPRSPLRLALHHSLSLSAPLSPGPRTPRSPCGYNSSDDEDDCDTPTTPRARIPTSDARVRKMAKLVRTLGEDVPAALVFPASSSLPLASSMPAARARAALNALQPEPIRTQLARAQMLSPTTPTQSRMEAPTPTQTQISAAWAAPATALARAPMPFPPTPASTPDAPFAVRTVVTSTSVSTSTEPKVMGISRFAAAFAARVEAAGAGSSPEDELESPVFARAPGAASTASLASMGPASVAFPAFPEPPSASSSAASTSTAENTVADKTRKRRSASLSFFPAAAAALSGAGASAGTGAGTRRLGPRTSASSSALNGAGAAAHNGWAGALGMGGFFASSTVSLGRASVEGRGQAARSWVGEWNRSDIREVQRGLRALRAR